MTAYREFTAAQAQDLLDKHRHNTTFNSWQIAAPPTPISLGALHSVFLVRTSEGPFVIKLMEPFCIPSATATYDELYHTQQEALKNGAHVPELLLMGVTPNNQTFYIERYVEGEKAYPPTEMQAYNVGMATAAFHCSLHNSAAFETPPASVIAMGLSEGRDWISRIFHNPQNIGQDIRFAVASLRHGRHVMVLRGKTQDLPTGKIHGDLNEGNVLFQKERACLVDFETVQESPLLQDIAGIVYHFSIIPHAEGFVFSPSLSNAALAGYNDRRSQHELGPITQDEKRLLPETLFCYAEYRRLAEFKTAFSGKNIIVTADQKMEPARQAVAYFQEARDSHRYSDFLLPHAEEGMRL